MPEGLLESEFFGYRRGAFTGAVADKAGKFEMANGGTIFLDEIGDMPAATQTKILRVLQNGEFQRVGGNQTIRVDVRVIAATNRDPEELVRDKKFREDLFYRLHVVRIEMPPLRDRRGDIPLLVDYFLRRKTRKTISADTMELLKKHPWPGNVRELENAVERAAVMARTNTIMTEDLPPEVREPRAAPVSAQESDSMIDDAVRKLVALAKTDPKLKLIAVMERELIACALKDTGGNQVKAAKLLGITRATLRKRIEKFGIERRIEVS
jgi:two-component system nitrogen regulation response regulator GlnG